MWQKDGFLLKPICYLGIIMLDKFYAYLSKNQLISYKSTTLLAISGGVDSVVMAYLFNQSKFKFVISHCHFGLRGQDSDDDQAFVHRLAQRYNVPFYTKQFDLQAYIQKHKLSVQMAARSLRYRWFEFLLAQYKFDQVATAHHINDQLETFLYNIAKGTGLSGLHGILPKQGAIVRPLGFATKRQIVQFAQKCKLTWREDKSNRVLGYRRNWMRHKVIPYLKRVNPSLENTFITTLTKLRQVENVFDLYTAELKREVFQYRAPYYYLDLTKVNPKNCPTVVAFEWLREFGFSFNDLQRWWGGRPHTGKKLYSTTHWLLADRNSWIVGDRKKRQFPIYAILASDQLVNTPKYTLHIALKAYQNDEISKDSAVAFVDADKLSFPLELRPWQAGDFFSPLGMCHRKKVSDFLIDHKVPLHLKKQVYVLTSSDKIVWVVGHRIDNRFKLTHITQKVYQISMALKPEA